MFLADIELERSFFSTVLLVNATDNLEVDAGNGKRPTSSVLRIQTSQKEDLDRVLYASSSPKVFVSVVGVGGEPILELFD